jgi:cytochrome c-type biogenesis protein CcmH/NrfF
VRRAATTLLTAVALLATSEGAAADAATPRTSLPDVEDEVMCVLCNVALNVAGDEPQAVQERNFIRRLVAQGLTKEQVKHRMVAEYGEDVLALPDDRGINVAAYAVPIALVLAMLAGAAVMLPRWRRRTPGGATAGAAPPPAASDAELQRLDEDLARYE